MRTVLFLTIILVPLMLQVSLISVSADPGVVAFTLEGLTLGSPYGYTTGLVRGYSGCEWIPFNLTINNKQSTPVTLNIKIDLDYNITQGSAEGAIGIDAFGTDDTQANRWNIAIINVTASETITLGPYPPALVHFSSIDKLEFSFTLTVPQNTMVWILWQSHLAKTDTQNLFDPTDTIEMGSSHWPGARLHVEADLSGDVNGLRSVPIMRPPHEKPQTATIGGYKFHDKNADGIFDIDEEGLENWEIQLWRWDGANWVNVINTITGSDGAYEFNVDAGGTYRVMETLKLNWMQTAPGAPGYYEIDVVLGQTYPSRDFGNIMLGSISSDKFYDANVNGVRDYGELPIEGWKVHLTGTDIRGGPVDLYGFTDSEGKFIFDNLLPGNYMVTEVFPLTPTYISTTATSFNHELEEGENFFGPCFGNVCLKPGCGGYTLGFWSNKNGQSLITPGDRTALNALNLYHPAGWLYPPFTLNGQIKTYLLSANAVDMRWMLSAQLIATKLDVLHGFLSASTIVYVGTSSYVPTGFISIGQIINNANTALLSGNRATQEFWKDMLDDLNNNKLPFVCPHPCLPLVYP